MPFGLKNALVIFQRLMDLILTGLQKEELFVYMDNIVIYVASLEEHERKYNLLIEWLRKADLKLQPDKCEFLKTEVTYLRHIISKDGVKPDPKKLKAVGQFPRPKIQQKYQIISWISRILLKIYTKFFEISQTSHQFIKKMTNLNGRWIKKIPSKH